MSADITTAPATGVNAYAFPRHEQTFPVLTPQEIERMRRFGVPRSYRDGEALFETGTVGPGMFVVLSGTVAVSQRDGLGHVTPIIDQGAGQFLAEIGQLSGRLALVDGHAEGDVEPISTGPPAPPWIRLTRRRINARMIRSPSSASATSSARNRSGGISSVSTSPSA